MSSPECSRIGCSEPCLRGPHVLNPKRSDEWLAQHFGLCFCPLHEKEAAPSLLKFPLPQAEVGE